MIEYLKTTTKVYVGNNAQKVNLFIAQQKLIKAVKNYFTDESEKETVVDKLLDCNDRDIEKIFTLFEKEGIKSAAMTAKLLKQTKTKS